MKRILSLFLSIVMIFVLIPITTNAATTGGVQAKINNLVAVYPSNSYFTKSGNAFNDDLCTYPSYDCGDSMSEVPSRGGLPSGQDILNMGIGNGHSCNGFVTYCFGYIFGQNWRTATVVKTPSIGDAVHMKWKSTGGNHYFIYLGEDSTYYYIYHSNGDSGTTNKVLYNYALAKSNVTIQTIYHATNYDSINGSTTPTPQPTYTDISNGTYFLKNNNNGKYLHVPNALDEQARNILTFDFCDSDADHYRITKDGNAYKLQPTCSSTRVVNAYAWTVSSGTNVNLYDDLGSSETSQRWYFEKVTNGYVIRNAQTPSCVLAVDSTDNAYVTTYTGASSQIWTIQNTVKYDANGGSSAPNQQLKDYGKTLTLSSTVPTRSGYNFLGWSESSSATSATYSAGGSFTKNANTTLYAVWAYKTYTVSYNANGGSGAPGSQTKTHGSTLKLSSTVPTRDGYTFVGWATSSSATSATYNAGSNYTNNASVTLYAVWNKNTTVLSKNSSMSATISSVGDIKYYTFTPTTSGTYVIYSTGSDDTKVYLYDANGNELDSDDDGGESTNFRLEYNFTAGTEYTFGVEYYNSSKTGTIQFNFGDIYTITYNANNGSGAPVSQSKDYGAPIVLSSDVPTRNGYTFLGWSESSSATSATYNAGSTYTNNASVTLYAVWNNNATVLSKNSSMSATISSGGDIKYYTFTPTTSGTYVIYSTGSDDTQVYLYDANGNELDSDDDSGESYNFRLEYNFTAGTEYTFDVKYYDSSKTGTIQFKFGDVYTITYNANNGSGAPVSQSKDYGAPIVLSSDVPTRNGYAFLGWSESSSATSATYNAGSNYTNNASVTLYAVWAQSVYTNTIQHWVYVGTGGDNSDGTQKLMGTSTFECESATTVTIPESSIVNYWCYYSTGEAGSNWGTNTFSSKDIGSTFVQPDRSITIEYYYMPKTIEIYYFKTEIEEYGKMSTYVYGNTNYRFGYTDDGILLWEEDELTRPGYKFIGWSETRDATTPDYSTSDYMSESWFTNKVMFSGAKTVIDLYTVWEKVENLLGDVNNDKKVDSLDYLLVKRACFKTYTFSNDEFTRADVNGDSKIDSSDYLLVKRIAFGTYKAS